jgi:methylmalonyl-CoA/ethylmalonyl-CoA epimerase
MRPIDLDHIAIAMPRLTDAPVVLAGVLGGEPVFGMDTPHFTFGHWRFAGGGRIEVLAPRGERAFLHRFLETHGPGVHHVTFRVPDLRAICHRAETAGYTIVGYSDSDPRWKEAFLHPREAGGIVVQLAESPDEDSSPGWIPPPGPENPPPAVTLLGLRLRVRSREHAVRQWGALIGGALVDETAKALTYRWPPSPLRLVIDIDPHADDGPVCVEITSDRAIALSPAHTTMLGIDVCYGSP